MTMIYLKPRTEMMVVLHALAQHEGGTESTAYYTIKDVWSNFPDFEVHEDISLADLEAFVPLLWAVEQQVGIPLENEEIWYLHGVLDTYAGFVRPDCDITQHTLHILTMGVAQLDMPPY